MNKEDGDKFCLRTGDIIELRNIATNGPYTIEVDGHIKTSDYYYNNRPREKVKLKRFEIISIREDSNKTHMTVALFPDTIDLTKYHYPDDAFKKTYGAIVKHTEHGVIKYSDWIFGDYRVHPICEIISIDDMIDQVNKYLEENKGNYGLDIYEAWSHVIGDPKKVRHESVWRLLKHKIPIDWEAEIKTKDQQWFNPIKIWLSLIAKKNGVSKQKHTDEKDIDCAWIFARMETKNLEIIVSHKCRKYIKPFISQIYLELSRIKHDYHDIEKREKNLAVLTKRYPMKESFVPIRIIGGDHRLYWYYMPAHHLRKYGNENEIRDYHLYPYMSPEALKKAIEDLKPKAIKDSYDLKILSNPFPEQINILLENNERPHPDGIALTSAGTVETLKLYKKHDIKVSEEVLQFLLFEYICSEKERISEMLVFARRELARITKFGDYYNINENMIDLLQSLSSEYPEFKTVLNNIFNSYLIVNKNKTNILTKLYKFGCKARSDVLIEAYSNNVHNIIDFGAGNTDAVIVGPEHINWCELARYGKHTHYGICNKYHQCPKNGSILFDALLKAGVIPTAEHLVNSLYKTIMKQSKDTIESSRFELHGFISYMQQRSITLSKEFVFSLFDVRITNVSEIMKIAPNCDDYWEHIYNKYVTEKSFINSFHYRVDDDEDKISIPVANAVHANIPVTKKSYKHVHMLFHASGSTYRFSGPDSERTLNANREEGVPYIRFKCDNNFRHCMRIFEIEKLAKMWFS